MNVKFALRCGVAAASLVAGSVDAATINLVDLGGVTGSQAEQGFRVAANYWGSLFTNNVTINLGVRFAPLDPGIIGSTGSKRLDYTVANWETRINATKSNSAVDRNIVLPTLTGGGASFITNGTADDGNDDTGVQFYNDAATTSSRVLYLNSSVVKAIGGSAGSNTCTLASNANCDGRVTFSSNFNFDFNPGDGVTPGTFDFIGVAIHEIGHALGFVSGVDFLDYYGYPDGPGAGALGYSLNDTSIFSALDLFRYSNDPNGLAPGAGPTLDLSVGGTRYFSIDGGATALFGNTFSTGSYNGDGRQVSHWKDASGANACGPQLGIMDPTFCFGQTGVVTGLDLAAFDAIGWNLSANALTYRDFSTTKILRQYLGTTVPEPGTWALMIAGFAFVGAAMRRQTARVSFAV